MVGTIEYIAPERIKGSEADARADIYSLGVVLYEMLTGHLPFESDSEYEIMRGHVQEPPPPFLKFGPSVPAAIESVVMMSLAKIPDQRIQSCSAFLDALRNASQGLMPSPDSALYASAQTINAQGSRISDVNAPSGYKPTRMTPTPAVGMASAATNAGPKATRLEPAPQQFGPGAPLIQMPPGVTAPAGRQSGFLGRLNWRHYSAAAAVLVIIAALAAVLSTGKTDTAAAPEKPAVTTPAVAAPAPAAATPTPAVIPATSPAVQPQIPVSDLDASNKDVAPLTPGGSDDQEKEAARAARREAARAVAKKKAEALKALDEQ